VPMRVSRPIMYKRCWCLLMRIVICWIPSIAAGGVLEYFGAIIMSDELSVMSDEALSF